MTHSLAILSILCLSVFAAEWLVRRTFCRHLGTALLVIVIAAVLANLGAIPSASRAPPLYDGIFAYVAPIAIFLSLLEVNLGRLRRAGPAMLAMFVVGSGATVLGVLIGLSIVPAMREVGAMLPALGGMFTATYTGGSVNFNAVALHFDVVREGELYAGALAVDNIMTAVWMIASIGLPKLLEILAPRRALAGVAGGPPAIAVHEDTEAVDPAGLAILIALAAASLWFSDLAAAWLTARGAAVPSILILTSIALILAQFEVVNALPGSRALAMFSIYLFLAVIGAHAELAALAEMGRLGLILMSFVAVLIAVHGTVIFGVGALARQDWALIAVASQANIGGSTSALALARSLGRGDLALPAVLVGALGYGLGSYLGFLVAGWL